MSRLRSDLDTVKAGLATLLHFTLNEPKWKGGDAKGLEAHEKLRKAHNDASDKWAQEEAPKIVDAAFNVFAQFFKDINAIADGVNK